MGRAERSRHTKAGLMRVTPSAPWNGLLRRPVSDMHIGSRVIRTSREQNFRMAPRNRFRMNAKINVHFQCDTWLGREDSNLRMAESKSDKFHCKINVHS